MLRAARAPAPASDPELAEAKLSLVEFLVACESAAEGAQWTLDWMAGHLRVRRGLCLLIDEEGTRLVAIAASGAPATRLERFSVDLEQRDHPLVAALRRPGPLELSPSSFGARMRRPPLSGTAPFLVVPLGPTDGRTDEASGLLLVGPSTPALAREAPWIARVLGPKLARLRAAEVQLAMHRRLQGELSLVQGMINTVPDPILLTDSEGRMILANARAEALFVAAERESEGRRRAIALNNMLFSAALAGRNIHDVEPMRRELPLVDPDDGSDLLFELISTTARDPEGRVGVVSVLRNTLDLRRAVEDMEENYRRLRQVEAEVRAERDRLQLVIDSVADPILVTDPGGAILLMNAPAERLFTAPGEAAGEHRVRVQANDAHFSSFLANVLFGSEVYHAGRIGLVDPETGEILPVEAVAGKVLSQQNELIGIVTILHDQTQAIERERLYEQVKRAAEEMEEKVRQATAELVRQNELLRRQALQLEQASALKSQFLANMSHEFRTPLNAILGYTSMLLQGVAGEMTPPQKRSLTRVDSSARHLLALINDILDISRIEAGKMPLHVSEFAIPELVHEVSAEVEPLVSRTRLAFLREVPAALPPMVSDRGKVKQIVLNFLTNALKFTAEGWVKVSVALERAGDRVVIAVSDTGIGIAEEDQVKIFEDFSQADSSMTRAYGGAGLGLSISRRLASMLGGRISVQSKTGKGSTFTLAVPRVLGP